MTTRTMTTWQLPNRSLKISPGELHLWKFRLHDQPHDDLLSREEKQRVAKLRVPAKAHAFMVARTRLRQILSRYLDMAPTEIAFDYNENGKPFLVNSELRFNLSHSGGWGLCAVTLHHEIGADLEEIKTEMHFQPLAERFFSDRENNWLRTTSPARRRRSFYRLWTRKEAWLKGQGGGFSELVSSLDPLHIANATTLAQGWWLGNVFVARGYVAAVAVNGTIKRLSRWEWPAEKPQACS